MGAVEERKIVEFDPPLTLNVMLSDSLLPLGKISGGKDHAIVNGLCSLNNEYIH